MAQQIEVNMEKYTESIRNYWMVQVKSVFDKYMSSQRKEQKIEVTGHGK